MLSSIQVLDKKTGEYRSAVDISEICQHTKEERAFITVIDQQELEHALKRGYTVSNVYHALVWYDEDAQGRPLWSKELFKGTCFFIFFLNVYSRIHPRFSSTQSSIQRMAQRMH